MSASLARIQTYAFSGIEAVPVEVQVQVGPGLPAFLLPTWYDVDDAETFALLEAELAGAPPGFAPPGLIGGAAPHTRALLAKRTRTSAA